MPPVLSGPTVSTQWLADHLGSDDLVVLDVTVLAVRVGPGAPAYVSGYDRYLLDGHVPGAVFADPLAIFSGQAGGSPDAAAFLRAAASVGVGDSSTVVVYDSAGGAWASRMRELFLGYGFEAVAVLDGGLTAWLTEGRETDTGRVEPGACSMAASPALG